MRSLKLFFRSVLKTFTSPAYYADIYRAKFSFSLKFFYAYFFLFTLVATSIITARFIIPFNTYLQSLPQELLAVYPDDLIVSVQNGEVSINKEEPYFIPFSSLKNIIPMEKKEDIQDRPKSNLLVIDTNASVEDLPRYDSYALLTKTSLSYFREGHIETNMLTNAESITIEKKLMTEFVAAITPFLSYAVPILTLIVFLGLFSYYTSGNLIRNLLFALIAVVIGRIVNNQIGYKKSYQFMLHSIIIPITIFSLIEMFYELPTIPFRDAIFIAGWMLLVLIRTKDRLSVLPFKTPPDPVSTTPPSSQTQTSDDSSGKSPSIHLSPTIPPNH